MTTTETLLEARETARRTHFAGAPGRQVATQLSAAMDALVCANVEHALAQLDGPRKGEPWAIVALGGWGRGELCPASDLDLLLLYRRQTDLITKLARGLFYPLWDAGLDVGHGVRTVGQCLGVSTLDLPSRTALLDARLIAGEAVLAEELRRGLLKQLRRAQGEAFFRALAEEREQRHLRFSGQAASTEPHLKDGPGGLRDIHGMRWALRVLAEVRAAERRPEDIPNLSDRPEESESADFLLRLRSHIHFLAGRRCDQLLLRYQADAAQFMGFTEESGLRAAVLSHMAAIEQATAALWPRLRTPRGWR
jgi:[protein-PII] uridylyltransferase